jgi:Nuclease A inhibitor-like protein
VEEVPVAEFFAALAETDDAAKFTVLEATLKKALTDRRVYRVGGSATVEIYVLGKAPSDELLGL